MKKHVKTWKENLPTMIVLIVVKNIVLTVYTYALIGKWNIEVVEVFKEFAQKYSEFQTILLLGLIFLIVSILFTFVDKASYTKNK